MAPTAKPREKRRKCCFFPGGCCFGSFREHEKNMFSDPKLVEFGSIKKSSKTVPIGDSTFMTTNSSKEIHMVVEAEQESSEDPKLPLPSLDHHLIVNKDMIREKTKNMDRMLKELNKQNSIKLSHSVSMPQLRRKSGKVGAGGGGVKEKQGNEIKAGGVEFDPLVGALILTVTLIVMLVWGKVSAVLCTAVWFYFMPRLMTRPNNTIHDSYAGPYQIDVDSSEYKNKVVLQGFLDRN